jgi:hypothetical protein
MAEILTQAEIDQFREQGFVSPIRVMPAAEAFGYRRQLERFERETGGPLGGHLWHKTHLLFTWLADLIRHPRILDAVDDLYSPDLSTPHKCYLSPHSPDEAAIFSAFAAVPF